MSPENIKVLVRVFTIDALACMITRTMDLLVVEFQVLMGITHHDLHVVILSR